MSVSGNNSAVCNKFRVCVLLVVSVVFSSFLAVVTAVEDRDEVNGLTLATNHSAIVLGEQLDVRLFRDGPSSLTLDAESVEITGRLVFTNASSSSSSSSTTTTATTTTTTTTTTLFVNANGNLESSAVIRSPAIVVEGVDVGQRLEEEVTLRRQMLQQLRKLNASVCFA